MRSTASIWSGHSTAVPSRRSFRLVLGGAAVGLVAMLLPATAPASTDTTQFPVVAGPLGFGSPPVASEPPRLVLSAPTEAQKMQINDFSVTDATGSGGGWNITVSGARGPGKSPVFKQYCPSIACGKDSGPGYVPGGEALPPNSLTLNSTGASFSAQGDSTGKPPSQQCDHGCFVDTPPGLPTKIVSAPSGAGMGTFRTTGWSSSSLSLAAPRTVLALTAGEVYRLDLVWSLDNGP